MTLVPHPRYEVVGVHDPATIDVDSAVAFRISSDDARKALVSWAKSKRLRPWGLLRRARNVDIEASYLPYYAFDASTITQYTGKRGWAAATEQRFGDTLTVWREVSGEVPSQIRGAVVPAFTEPNPALVDAPFGTDAIGFEEPQAVRPQLHPQEALERAYYRPLIRQIDRDISADMGGYTHEMHRRCIYWNELTVGLCAYPIWVAQIAVAKQPILVPIDGVTGGVHVDIPTSATKVFLIILVIAAVILAIFLVLSSLE